jgi:hypothetical protein
VPSSSSTQVATLNGFPLLGLNPVKWVSRIGVAPVVEGFDITPGVAEKLPAGTECTLIIKDGETEHKFEKLIVVKRAPGASPQIARIMVADQRWKWPFKHILRRYNMRRRTGIGRRINWSTLELDYSQRLIQQAFAFAPYSLQFGKHLWTPEKIVGDILDSIDPSMDWVFAEIAKPDKVPVENLVLDDSGNNALNRALGFIPGATIVVDPNGQVRVFDRQAYPINGEEEIVGFGVIGEDGKAGPEIVGGGGIELISDTIERPKAVDVLFTIEAELRFDFLGDDDDQTVVQGPRRIVENVIQIPDFELTLHPDDQAALGTPTVAQGTWLTIAQAVRAWGQGEGALAKVMSSPAEADRLIRQAFIPRMGLWASMGLAGQLDLQGSALDWGGRLSALQAHYRQSFRIQREYRDTILSLAPYLVATIDPISGQRAPALAFADHAIRNSQKAVWLSSKNGAPTYATNISGYPGVNKTISSSSKPAPAVVQILDQDQGILRVAYQPDPYGMADMIFPSKLENVPTANKRKSNSGGIAFNAMTAQGKVPILSASQNVAVILTAVPAAPNRTDQLYRIRVEAPSWAGDARGPVKEIRVGAGLETARIAWHESKRSTINRIFGVPYGDYLRDPRAELQSLCINDKPQTEIGKEGGHAASLQVIAKAIAQSIYIETRPRVQGSMSCRMDSTLPVQGSISEISHTLRSNGAAVSMIGLPDSLKPIDILAFMPESTRQILMKLVQPQ